MAAGEGLGNSGGDIPGADASGNVSGEEGLAVSRGGQGHHGLGVALDDLGGLGAALVKVAEVASEVEGHNVVALPETTDLLVLDGVSELKGVGGGLGGDIPDLDGLVSRAGEELLSII